MAAALPDAPTRAGEDGETEVAVVVVNWKRSHDTVTCGRRVLEWQRVRSRLVVVDNESEEGAIQELRRELDGATILISEDNRGFGGANNLALEQVGEEFVLLLNNDASVEEEAVEALLDFMRSRPDVGIAGPVLESSGSPRVVLAAGGRDILRHGRTHWRADERRAALESAAPFAVDYVPGTVALVRASLLAELDGFDEAYFFSGEMADLATRAAGLGRRSFVVPAARARHDLSRASHLRDSLYAYYSLRNRFLYARRHGRHPQLDLARWVFRGAFACGSALVRGHGNRCRWLARAVLDGTAGRFGPLGAEAGS